MSLWKINVVCTIYMQIPIEAHTDKGWKCQSSPVETGNADFLHGSRVVYFELPPIGNKGWEKNHQVMFPQGPYKSFLSMHMSRMCANEKIWLSRKLLRAFLEALIRTLVWPCRFLVFLSVLNFFLNRKRNATYQASFKQQVVTSKLVWIQFWSTSLSWTDTLRCPQTVLMTERLHGDLPAYLFSSILYVHAACVCWEVQLQWPCKLYCYGCSSADGFWVGLAER